MPVCRVFKGRGDRPPGSQTKTTPIRCKMMDIQHAVLIVLCANVKQIDTKGDGAGYSRNVIEGDCVWRVQTDSLCLSPGAGPLSTTPSAQGIITASEFPSCLHGWHPLIPIVFVPMSCHISVCLYSPFSQSR